MIGFYRLWHIALVEWKLQVRTVIFWASLSILLLYTLGQIAGAPREMAFLPRQWIGGREDSLSWLGIVLIFLTPSALARDRRTGVLLWTTPIGGGIYAAGKLLGIWLVALSLAGIEMTAQMLVRVSSWSQLTPDAFDAILNSVAGWLIGIIYITSVYFLLTVLVRGQPLLAYVLNAIYFVASFSIKDPANPFGFIPFAIFISDMVGEGPEGQLIHAHVVLYFALSLIVIALALFLFPQCERRSLFPKAERLILLIGLILGLGIVVWALMIFAQEREQILAAASMNTHTPPETSAEVVRSIHVVTQFNPQQGRLRGEVELVLAYPSDLVFHLPFGLKILSATDCQGQLVQMTHIEAESVQVAAALRICVTFAGAWRLNRASYRQYGHMEPEEVNLNAGAYIGDGYAYITPLARWYPAPVGPSEWQARHKIEITMPRALRVLTSPPAIVSLNGEWVTYRWESANGRPLISLIAGNYHEVSMQDSCNCTVWAAPQHQHVAQQAANFYLAFLKRIDSLIRKPSPSYSIVETPVLRWPIVAGQLVFLPERYFIERLSPAIPTDYESSVQAWGPQEAFRMEMHRVTRGWLQGQAFFADPPLAYDILESPNSSLDPFSGYVPLQESLAHYIAMQLTDQSFGTHSLDTVMNARIRYADQYLDDPAFRQLYPGANFSDLPVPPYERSWAFNQMFAALGRLERHVGREQVNHMIGILIERYTGSTITVDDWLTIVAEIGGVEARQEFETTYQVQSEVP